MREPATGCRNIIYNTSRIAKSVARAALMLFLLSPFALHASYPLTETIYTIPEGKISAGLSVEAFQADRHYREEDFVIGLGVLSNFTVWYSFMYYSDDLYAPSRGRLGDSFLSMWYYAGNYCNNTIHAGIFARFRIPTGKNVYTARDYYPTELGNNELLAGPVVQARLWQVTLHANLFYAAREKPDESMSLLGVNPTANDSFLSKRNMGNDYITCSLTAATDVLYPFIPHLGLRGARLLSASALEAGDNEEVLVEGLAPVNAAVCEAGFRYFFTYDTYTGIYGTLNLTPETNAAIQHSAGLELALEF